MNIFERGRQADGVESTQETRKQHSIKVRVGPPAVKILVSSLEICVKLSNFPPISKPHLLVGKMTVVFPVGMFYELNEIYINT